MTRTFYCLLICSSLFILSCKTKEVVIPAYVFLKPSTLITKPDGTQGAASAKIEDYYVYKNGEVRGMFSVNSRIPIQAEGKTTMRLGAAVKYNGQAELRIQYPLFNYYDKQLDLAKKAIDTLTPTFTYVENAVFPLLEDFDQNSIELEYNPQLKQIGDTLIKDNSVDAWLPGKYSAKILLNGGSSQSFMELYTTKIFKSWPTNTPFYLELDYKSDVVMKIGFYITTITTGDVNYVPLYIANPKSGWNKLYLDLQTEIAAQGSNKEYRLSIGFSRGDLPKATALIDNLKIIYLD